VGAQALRRSSLFIDVSAIASREARCLQTRATRITRLALSFYPFSRIALRAVLKHNEQRCRRVSRDKLTNTSVDLEANQRFRSIAMQSLCRESFMFNLNAKKVNGLIPISN
jgi:hypothetical protein